MKAVQVDGIITTISSRKDGSLRLSLITPELTAEEKAEFMKLQSQNLQCLLNPLDIKNAPKYEVKSEFERKSPSLRLRNTLYVLWDQNGGRGDFDQFYEHQMEKFINAVKEKLV